MSINRQSGFVNLIYMGVIAVISVLVLVGSYSRLLVAVNSQNYFSNRLPQEYQAESAIENYLSLYYQGEINQINLGLPITQKLNNSNLYIDSSSQNSQNKIEATLTKGLRKSVYNLYYPAQIATTQNSQIIIALDCSSPQNGLNLASNLPVLGYAEDVVWINGDNGFYSCANVQNLGTTKSPGAAMVYLNNYFSTNENLTIILVVDGVPESVKLSSSSKCLKDVDCTLCGQQAQEYLACSIADTNTKWNRYDKGNRDPQIQLITVYVNQSSGDQDLEEILRKYSNSVVFPAQQNLSDTINDLINTTNSQSYRATLEKVVE